MARLLLCTVLTMLGVLPVLPAHAGNPHSLIQKQQARYRRLRKQWRKVQAPAGITLHPGPYTPRSSGVHPVVMHIQNVNLYLARDLGFHVIDLTIELVPKQVGQPVVVDDVSTYTMRVLDGRVMLSARDLDALFNQTILNYKAPPLHQVAFSTQNGQLIEKSGVKLWSWFPGFWLPLYLKGPVHLNGHDRVVYTPQAIHAIHIPVGGLIHFTHLPLDWLLPLHRPGAHLKGSKVYLNPRTVFPPPAIRGTVSKVRVTPQGMMLTFTLPHKVNFNREPTAKSYIWTVAGDVRLYDILMVNANILIEPRRPGSTLSFSLYGYRQQVARGMLKMPKNGELIARLPSYHPPNR